MVFPGTCREMLLAPAPLLPVSGSGNLETQSSQGCGAMKESIVPQIRTACVSQNSGHAYASHFCFPSAQQRAQHILSTQEANLAWKDGCVVRMGKRVVGR